LIENKPEAPWIRRTEDGIVFTDNIQIFQDLDLQSEERSGEINSLIKITNKGGKIETHLNARYSSVNSDGPEGNNISSNEKIQGNKKDILKDLKLDMDIEKKLQKIISREKKKLDDI